MIITASVIMTAEFSLAKVNSPCAAAVQRPQATHLQALDGSEVMAEMEQRARNVGTQTVPLLSSPYSTVDLPIVELSPLMFYHRVYSVSWTVTSASNPRGRAMEGCNNQDIRQML